MTFPNVYNPKRRGSRPKYGNKKVTIQGIKFDSKWESQRYLYLKSEKQLIILPLLEILKTSKK